MRVTAVFGSLLVVIALWLKPRNDGSVRQQPLRRGVRRSAIAITP